MKHTHEFLEALPAGTVLKQPQNSALYVKREGRFFRQDEEESSWTPAQFTNYDMEVVNLPPLESTLSELTALIQALADTAEETPTPLVAVRAETLRALCDAVEVDTFHF